MESGASSFRDNAAAQKKILTSTYQQHYGSTASPTGYPLQPNITTAQAEEATVRASEGEDNEGAEPTPGPSGVVPAATSREDDDDSSNNANTASKSPGQRTKSNQRWMKLRTTVQLSSAMQKKPTLKREDSFLKKFSTRQIPEVEDTGSEGPNGEESKPWYRQKRKRLRASRTVINPDENFYYYWLWTLTICVLYNMWTLIVRQSFPELQTLFHYFWITFDSLSDLTFAVDIVIQLRTGYLEQGLMVYNSKKLSRHYLKSNAFLVDIAALAPFDLLQLKYGMQPIVRFPRFLKVYRAVNCYYMVESRTVYPNFWRVINLIHILLILAHWFGCFYFLLSELEGFQGDWSYPYRPGDYATLTRKYLGSLYWSTLTLTTIGDLPTPDTDTEYIFTIVSYLIGVFIFATIVGQVGNVITNRNANRLEFERLLDGAKTYMRHHKVPGGMKRRVLRWYDYSWSRGRIQGAGDINTALGLLPDKLKTELALHVNLTVLKKVTIFQECQPEFLHDLVLKMKAYIFTPGDTICRKGEVAREMFIIADGILEVIAENGRVMTSMMAGDFFGEIGILNLDGLNKRTADVRSVGYSELFSLSREDVLAAMKDYPEAEEILQALGRKRLQEARKMSRKFRGEPSPDEKSGEDEAEAPKKMAHKFRSDSKVIRNVMRCRSRVSRRSGETIELQPLEPRLRRMTRVNSDDSQQQEQESQENGESTSDSKNGEKGISPIGAGLPLLTRLKLLKEKQDREEKLAKQRPSTSSVNSLPPIQPMPSTSSAPDEPEVIGAGLPLMQRLLLLKEKEDREKNLLSTSDQPSSSDTISTGSIKSPLSPTVKHISPIRKRSESSSPGKLQSPTTKTSRKSSSSGSSDGASKPKVSFKDRILQVQSDGKSVCQPLDKVATEVSTIMVETTQKTDSNLISIPHSVVEKLKSPVKSIGSSSRDKLKLLQSAGPTKESDNASIDKIKSDKPPELSPFKESHKKPWTKLKRAAILSDSKSKTSVEEKSESETFLKESADTVAKGSVDICIPTISTGKLVKIGSASAAESKGESSKTDRPIIVSETLKEDPGKTGDSMTMSPKILSKTTDSLPDLRCALTKDKRYKSIDDLPPEYRGLPFEKKLKILNETQKLVELENVIKIRSSSLDNISSSEDLLGDTLTRSNSEDNIMYKRQYKRRFLDSVGSHESNETLERRTLKSILKKLSEDVTPAESPERSNELTRLIRAPTIEGYAARHSKFAKSVTFHRHTLPSPPSSTSEMADDVFEIPKPTELITPTQQITGPDTEYQLSPTDITPDVGTEYNVQQSIDPVYDYKPLRPQDISVSSKKKKKKVISTVSKQRLVWKGSSTEDENFGGLLIAIKDVVQSQMHEIQGTFRDSFNSLEMEVRKRDDVIYQLQNRIQELEDHGLTEMQAGSGFVYEEDVEIRRQYESRDSSSGSDGEGVAAGFMRGDSLDTVLTKSPPEAPSEIYIENETGAGGITIENASDYYSKREKEKLKQRKSRERQNEALESQESRSTSPQVTSEDRSLLTPKRSSIKRTTLQFFGSHSEPTKPKIKKTSSVDTGMHQTGQKSRPRQQRKFSLFSFFGQRRRRNDIEHNAEEDPSESDSTGTSDSDCLPGTPLYEEFLAARVRRPRRFSSFGVDVEPDWEMKMLVEQLAMREQEKEDHRRRLRDLEEESDTAQRDSMDDSNTDSATTGDSDTAQRMQAEAATSRGPLFRATSLDIGTRSIIQRKKYGSLKSTHSRKRL